MEPYWLAEFIRQSDSIVNRTKYPLNLLTLHGKTLKDPSLTFNKITAYQIRNSSIDGLPELALFMDFIHQSQRKSIVQRVDDCFRLLKTDEVDGFIVLFPSCCGLSHGDKQILAQIYSKHGLISLWDRTFFLVSGSKMSYSKHHREFQTEVINFFAGIGAILGEERWILAKHRFAHLQSLGHLKMVDFLTCMLTLLKLNRHSVGLLVSTVTVDEHEQMMQITKGVRSFTNLLELEDCFKYFASRTAGVSTTIANLCEQAFADPSYYPMLYVSINFGQLLKDIKHRMPNANEYNILADIEANNQQRFWNSRPYILTNADLGYYIFEIQYQQRCFGNRDALEIAFDAVPLARFPRNISLYRPKSYLTNIGNYMEIGEPDNSYNAVFSFEQHMDYAAIPNCYLPWYLFVNEANVAAYEEVLCYIISKAYFGAKHGTVNE